MTGHRLNATAELRFPKRWGRYRPHRPYRPTPRIHKGLRADGMSVACAQTVHDAPNPAPGAPTFAHGPRGRQASTPWATGTPCCHVGQRRASGAATGGLGVGTTLPGHRARAAGAVANIDTVCLRAKKKQWPEGGTTDHRTKHAGTSRMAYQDYDARQAKVKQRRRM